MTNKQLGNIKVLGRVYPNNTHNKVMWACECECGENITLIGASLVSGNTKSCGCLRKKKTHGKSKTPEYNAWKAMIHRCTNPNYYNYGNYGKRGITVCSQWLKFEKFYKDMGKKPLKEHTLERIDNEKGYSKENCKWETMMNQNRNRRTLKCNKIGQSGVYQEKGKLKWYAHIYVNKKRIFLGSFDSSDDAIESRLKAEVKYWGKRPTYMDGLFVYKSN